MRKEELTSVDAVQNPVRPGIQFCASVTAVAEGTSGSAGAAAEAQE